MWERSLLRDNGVGGWAAAASPSKTGLLHGFLALIIEFITDAPIALEDAFADVDHVVRLNSVVHCGVELLDFAAAVLAVQAQA